MPRQTWVPFVYITIFVNKNKSEKTKLKMNASSIVIMVPSTIETDVHICGSCKLHFYSLQDFIIHKMRNCTVPPKNLNRVNIVNKTNSCEVEDHLQPEELNEPIDSSQSEFTLFRNILNLMSSQDPVNIQNKSTLTLNNNNNNAMPEYSGKKRQRLRCTVQGCNYSSFLKKDLERHTRVHTGERPFKCSDCSKSFTRSDKLQVHQRIHSGKKPYKCSECTYASIESGSLAKHMRIHKHIKPFKCQLCTYQSCDKSQLTVHLRTHTGDAPFVCTFEKCKSAFKTNSDLKRHSNIHSPIKAYPCHLCPYRSSFKKTLLSHLEKQHPNDEDGIKKPHYCPNCPDMPFQTIRKLKNHLKKKHNTPNNSLTENKVLNKMNNKQKRKPNERAMECVMRKDYNCKECSAAFVSPGNLRIHERQHLKQKTILAEPVEANLTNFYMDSNKDKILRCDKSNVMLNPIEPNVNQRASPVYFENGDLEAHLKTAEMLASLSGLQLPRTYSDAAVYFNSDDDLNNASIELNL